jgi:hypothetical protein
MSCVILFSLSLCIIISFFYHIDRGTLLPASALPPSLLSAKKRRIYCATRSTLCQQTTSQPHLYFVLLSLRRCFRNCVVHRFIFSSISHHSIQHSSYSPSISFDTNNSVLIIYPTLPFLNQPPHISCPFLFLLHANSYLPLHFMLHNILLQSCTRKHILEVLHPIHSLVFFSSQAFLAPLTCCCRTIRPSLYVHTYYSSLLHSNTRRATRASSNFL